MKLVIRAMYPQIEDQTIETEILDGVSIDQLTYLLSLEMMLNQHTRHRFHIFIHDENEGSKNEIV